MPQSAEFGASLSATIKPMLTKREFGIAKIYYGIGCKKQTVQQIGEFYKVRRQRIADVYAGYSADEQVRSFLKNIPAYEKGKFLPYRLDQLCFNYNPTLPLLEAGIFTIEVSKDCGRVV